MLIDMLLYRPYTVVLTLLSLRSLVYGYAFASSSDSVKRLLIWDFITQTGIDPMMFGWVMMALSIISVVCLFATWYRVGSWTLTAQGLLWLYVGMCYILQDQPIFALVTGFIPCLIVGYTALMYKQFYSALPKRKKKSNVAVDQRSTDSLEESRPS